MKQEREQEALLKLAEKYEASLKDCTPKELRELRYKLKQVKEKLRSLNQDKKD
jgi:hypothetical protein